MPEQRVRASVARLRRDRSLRRGAVVETARAPAG
jgi:hypothetical protein